MQRGGFVRGTHNQGSSERIFAQEKRQGNIQAMRCQTLPWIPRPSKEREAAPQKPGRALVPRPQTMKPPPNSLCRHHIPTKLIPTPTLGKNRLPPTVFLPTFPHGNPGHPSDCPSATPCPLFPRFFPSPLLLCGLRKSIPRATSLFPITPFAAAHGGKSPVHLEPSPLRWTTRGAALTCMLTVVESEVGSVDGATKQTAKAWRKGMHQRGAGTTGINQLENIRAGRGTAEPRAAKGNQRSPLQKGSLAQPLLSMF